MPKAYVYGIPTQTTAFLSQARYIEKIPFQRMFCFMKAKKGYFYVKRLILFSNVPAGDFAKLVAFSISVIMTFCVVIIGY